MGRSLSGLLPAQVEGPFLSHCAWTSTRRTPLHAAAFADNVSGLRMLLQHEAEVDATDHTGRTALMTAAENGQTAAVGVFPEERHYPGVSARWVSPAWGFRRQEACLGCSALCRRDHNGCEIEGWRAKMAAALGRASVPFCPLSLAEFLLYRGKADLTVLDENKNTALHLACSKVLPAVVVRLHRAEHDEGAGGLDGAEDRRGVRIS